MDEYAKFLMRENTRREREFKHRAHDKDGIYGQVA